MDMYGNPYGMYGANPYLQNMMNSRVQAQSIHVDQVDGEQGARELPMPPGSEKLVLDKSGEMVWLVKTDTYGMKSLVAPYDITPHKTQQASQYDALDARLARLEEILSEFTDNTPTTDKPEPDKPIYAT